MNSKPVYTERFRPQYHFTPPKNWMNDPNGLVYYKGKYHLFYQHNPFGNVWGHISWGHAVSKDLIHWKHLPVAIREENDEMIFSGSVVVDSENTSGFGSRDNPALVAVYTAGRILDNNQSQCIAFSTDEGVTWKKYAGNPVIDIGSENFRDPKVFWYEKENNWIMVVALSAEQKVRFYNSHNLIDWNQVGEFKLRSETNEAWECPDLFPMHVDENKKNIKWTFTIGKWGKGIPGGSHIDYLIGDFNGKAFIPDKDYGNEEAEFSRLDFGRDFYAAHTWANIHPSDGRKIMLGWLSNWDYADYLPTSTWRNMHSIPRVIKLKTIDGKIKLIQSPVDELKMLRDDLFETRNKSIAEINQIIRDRNILGSTLEILCELVIEDKSECGLKVRKGKSEETTIKYDAGSKKVSVDRTNSGDSKFSALFSCTNSAQLLIGDRLKLHMFIDQSSVEVFVNEGEIVFSYLIFPSPESNKIELFSNQVTVMVSQLKIWRLS